MDATLLIAVDLGAAFDTVDHDIILDVLENQFEVRGPALAWMHSSPYICPRRVFTSGNLNANYFS